MVVAITVVQEETSPISIHTAQRPEQTRVQASV